MPHSLTKIWIHAILGTKYREPLIPLRIADDIYCHIKKHLEDDFHCRVRSINGTADHIHILFLLDAKYSLKDIMKNVKGESSHWINHKNIQRNKFEWQVGYGAFSVSESGVDTVEHYIAYQKEHHRKKTFLEEFEEYMNMHGLVSLPESVQTLSEEID